RAVERLHRTGVPSGPTAPAAVERCRRDVRTVAGHRMLRREQAAVDYARSVFSELSEELTEVTATARDLAPEVPHAEV
ncbi:oxidoreductase, partial [Streptomyces sp. NPDC005904]